MFQMMPALCPHGKAEAGMVVVVNPVTSVDRTGQGEEGTKNSQICADILYGWPLSSEAVVRRCFSKQIFLKISQYLKKNICVRVSFS